MSTESTSTSALLRVGNVELEYAWVGAADPKAPVIVFLHEGLGSLALWKRFPALLCETAGLRGLVYSRAGNGCSTPRAPAEHWQPDYMHRQAREVLPVLLDALGVQAPYLLFGHSDGASIALIHAASFPTRVAAAIVLAPHINVEAFGLASIRKAREAYLQGDLRPKLARYHADVDSAFWGWNDIWLDPRFESWTIESLLPSIRSPVLAIQGVDDEYGTMAQIDGIAAALPGTRLLKLQECGHSAHRDQPEQVISATIEFIAPMRSA
jgi:pimeloyl-ACP methyl ester carboxylesterase